MTFVVVDRPGGSVLERVEGGHREARAALWTYKRVFGHPAAVIWDVERDIQACPKRSKDCQCIWHSPPTPAEISAATEF